MPFTVRPYADADAAALLSLLRAPGIREEYDMLDAPDAVARLLGDPYTPEAGVRLAWVGDEPAGFGFAILIPGTPPWAALRGGVLPRFRRRGLARALHAELVAFVRAQSGLPGVRESSVAAWQPSPAPDALFGSLGYRAERWFWMMARPRGAAAPVPAWPEGVELRLLDGGEASLADYNEAYNDSFAAHYRYVPTDVERLRQLVRKPGFRFDGVLLAHRGGRVAGFCYCELHGERGEIGTLGTMRHARGIGLGRALLRWGVGWLERESTGAVTLVVDGENEGALRLYRSEGFEVTRTRRIWARALDPA